MNNLFDNKNFNKNRLKHKLLSNYLINNTDINKLYKIIYLIDNKRKNNDFNSVTIYGIGSAWFNYYLAKNKNIDWKIIKFIFDRSSNDSSIISYLLWNPAMTKQYFLKIYNKIKENSKYYNNNTIAKIISYGKQSGWLEKNSGSFLGPEFPDIIE